MTVDGKMGVFWVSSNFCGRLIGRRLVSSPNNAAVAVIHAGEPNGACRCKRCRS